MELRLEKSFQYRLKQEGEVTERYTKGNQDVLESRGVDSFAFALLLFVAIGLKLLYAEGY